LLVAVVYGILVSEEARHHTGTPQAVVTARLTLMRALYVAVLRSLFGANTTDQLERLTRAMRCLFQAWCKALLYPGPECEQGIHGVVIGCAQIRGGRIVDVDPWGGRRWVMHYPLWSYWGHQFGIAPLDVTASRLFSMICCLGGLPAPPVGDRLSTGTGLSTGATLDTNAGRTNFANTPTAVGHVFLVSGTQAQAQTQLRNAGVSTVATRELGLPEFISSLVLRLREQPDGVATQYTLFSLQGSPDVHFAAPVPVEASGTAAAAVQPRAQFVDRLPEAVHAAADPRTRSNVPPLLRSVSETISANLLRVAAVPRITEKPEDPLNQKLVAAGVSTYGALLSRDPQQVYQAVGTENGKPLSDLLIEAESVTATATNVAQGAMGNVAKQTGAAAARDLNNEAGVKLLTRSIVERISNEKRLALPEPVVNAVVANTLKAASA
jgi:hypothetical protein